MADTLVTTYLEMTERSQFRPAFLDDRTGLHIMRLEQVDLAFYKFLYRAVGDDWTWRDRLVIPEAQLAAELAESAVYVLYVGGVPAGYIELLPEGADTEVAYFGLRPMFLGRGLGKHLLSWGVDRAWQEGATRVWLHTCNLDSPIALVNYQKRGFVIYKTSEEPMPERYL